MKLYKIKSSPESTGYGLMARDDEGYCYVYSANTGLWHRSKARELDLAFEQKAVYEPVDSEEAAKLIGEVKPADRRSMGRYVDSLEAQPTQWKKTSAEVGVLVPEGARPIDAAVVQLALDRKRGMWTYAANYPLRLKKIAQKLASDVRRNQRKVFEGRKFEVETKTSKETVSVRLRPQREVEATTSKTADCHARDLPRPSDLLRSINDAQQSQSKGTPHRHARGVAARKKSATASRK